MKAAYRSLGLVWLPSPDLPENLYITLTSFNTAGSIHTTSKFVNTSRVFWKVEVCRFLSNQFLIIDQDQFVGPFTPVL